MANSAKHVKVTVAEQVAESLREYVRTYPNACLPAIRELSAHFGVSAPTMGKAVHLLAQCGILTVCERKRVRISGRTLPDPGNAIPPVTERLYEEIKNEIQTGSLSSGSVLPKINYYVYRDRVSGKTVSKVYRMLTARNLVHKSGKTFVVGPAVADTHLVRIKSKPAILVLLKANSAWTELCREERAGQFGGAFLREAEYYGIRLYEANTGRVSGVPRSEAMEKVSALIAGLGNQFRGTLIEGSRSEIPDVEDWARFLQTFRRPVVWFDKNEDGWKDLGQRSNQTYRCHYSEIRFVDCALNFLTETGHCRASFVYSRKDNWQENRARLLLKRAELTTPRLEVNASTLIDPAEWDSPSVTSIFEQIARLSSIKIPAIQATLKNLADHRDEVRAQLGSYFDAAWAAHPLAPAIALTRACHGDSCSNPLWRKWVSTIWSGLGLVSMFQSRSTALIAPNDYYCKWHHLNWLADLNIRVPHDVSVLSFDNAFRDSFFPLTSVDAGFRGLGRQAFHAIMQLTPVNSDRRGDIPALPRVIDRGSVAEPPRQPRSCRQ